MDIQVVDVVASDYNSYNSEKGRMRVMLALGHPVVMSKLPSGDYNLQTKVLKDMVVLRVWHAEYALILKYHLKVSKRVRVAYCNDTGKLIVIPRTQSVLSADECAGLQVPPSCPRLDEDEEEDEEEEEVA